MCYELIVWIQEDLAIIRITKDTTGQSILKKNTNFYFKMFVLAVIKKYKQYKDMCLMFVLFTGYSKEKNPVIVMMKMADERLQKGYLYSTDNSSYRFQIRKLLLFCRSIEHTSDMYILLKF